MLKIPIHAHGFSTSTYTPMECLNIDFIGPFPDGGYVLVIIDTFTRWVELFHTEDATALSTAKCLLQHLGRFGAPLQLRSDNGPTMHFLSDTDPIYLHTDASDYGVGAYLFQLVDGQETPIVFVSKSLSKAQLRWAVIQKEAYAIFYSCTYLESL
jgi:hypothetical protein